MKEKKIALVCDWIKDIGGAEWVLFELLKIFPTADVYTSVFFQQTHPNFAERKVTTSFIQNIPFLNRSHKMALFLRPRAFESFDLSDYDLVISSSSAESKGVITKPDCIHICYCHTPTRYFWSHYHEYLNMMEFGVFNLLGKWLMPHLVHKLRQWDFVASQRVDYFIANSYNTQRRIEKYYKRPSVVMSPGIERADFYLSEKQSYYLYVGRVIPYKKFDLVVEAFNKNEKPLIIVTNTKNKLSKELEAKSNQNILWKYSIPPEERNRLYSEAKAFIFPPEEDFGLVPLEAMASGTPVIAYRKGGACETVKEGETGVFFETQSVRNLNNAIEHFETLEFSPEAIREYAKRFDTSYFRHHLCEFVNQLCPTPPEDSPGDEPDQLFV